MLKAIGSNKSITTQVPDFYIHIKDILNSKIVNDLQAFSHHLGTTRFQHSLNVSYYNYLLCKKLKLDYRAAARAGLLHDLFFRHTNRPPVDDEGGHNSFHPKEAFMNASEFFSLSQKEGDIILGHMFPASLRLPKNKEAIAIILVDKYCALLECANYFYGFIRNTYQKLMHFVNKNRANITK